jgi:hypothetical protein
MTSVGKSAARSVVEFYFHDLHGFYRMVRPVKNPKVGDPADLNIASSRIDHDGLAQGKRRIP